MKRPSPETLAHVLALLALLALGGWVVSNTYWVDVWKRQPPRGEAARDEHYAVKQLLIRLGLNVTTAESLERLPPPGATLVLTSLHWNFLPERKQALRQWVEKQGGHLVLARFSGADNDMDWVPIRQRKRPPRAVAASAPKPQPSAPADFVGPAFPPQQPCAVHRESWPGQSPSTAEPRRFRLCDTEWESGLEALPSTQASWQIDLRDGASVLRVPLGRGQVTASSLWSLFDNHGLFRGQHAQAVVALLDARPGQTIWFVSDERRQALALWLWHRAGPAIGLAALALAFALWRGAVRFGPLLAQPPLGRRSMAEQIRGTSAFMLRGGGAPLLAAARRALDEAARKHLAGYEQMTLSRRCAALAAAASLPADALSRALDSQLTAPRGRALADRLALIESARRRLAFNASTKT